MNVVFNRPIRIGREVYPKSKKVVALDDKHAENWFIKAKMECGDISLAVAPAKAAVKGEVVAPPKK